MTLQSTQYAFKECEVNLPRGGTKKLAAGTYPVVVAGGIVTIDVITPTQVTTAEFFRLQTEGLAKKVP